MGAATDFGHSDWATEQRTQKAVRLEAHLHGLEYTAAAVERLTAADRRAFERAAGVRRSSDETWALVVRLMRSAEGGRS